MAYPSVSVSPGAEPASACKASSPKLTCLCSPTNHPGSFRCSRHRAPRARPPSSLSLSVRASQQPAMVRGVTGSKSVGGSRTTTSKGRPVLRAHLQRLLASPPPSSGGRRCREFKPRLSRLGRLAAASS